MRGPVAATQSGVPGDILTVGSGALSVSNTATTGIVGVLEQKLSSPTTSTMINYTMVLPGMAWEMSAGTFTGSAITDYAGVAADLGGTANQVGALVNTDSSHQLHVVGLASWFGQFEVWRIISDSATSETAGVTTYPDQATKGIHSDTQVRLIVTFKFSGLALSA
jgi:hypothetical protein